MRGDVCAPTRVKNTRATRSSVRPDRSSAATVLSNVGSPEATISSTSTSCSAIPALNAGRKCSSETAVKSGSSNGSVLGARNGLAAVMPPT